jgi:hypothetical protein
VHCVVHSRAPRRRRTLSDGQAIGLAVGSVLTAFTLIAGVSVLVRPAPKLVPAPRPTPLTDLPLQVELTGPSQGPDLVWEQ